MANNPADLLRQIRSTILDAEAAVSLRNVEIEMGPARFGVERGILIPAKTRDGETVELVFVGQARFRFDAPDEIEAGQMELFTGQPSLDAPVEEAVIVLTGPHALDALLNRPSPTDLRPELMERAREIHQGWLERTERRSTGVESAVFKALVGDAAFQNYFAIWCNSYERGEFVYQLDPEDVEPITLASFIPLDVSGWERRKLRRHIRIQQRKGRWLGVRLEDLGAWDIWTSTEWDPVKGSRLPGNVGFETRHYEIDVAIKRKRLLLEGTARLDLTAQTSGRRVVRLGLLPDLVVQRIADDKGRELFSFRSGPEVVVYLPEPSQVGQELKLEVQYSGRALSWVGGQTFDLQDTGNWYPHCGTVDRATYDVTLRWPKKYDLIASGELVEEGRQGSYRWERRRLDVPAIAFSFVLGDFLVEKRKIGDIDLTMAFNRGSQARMVESVREQAIETVALSMEYFQQIFGPYPMKQLTVVTVPRQYSQSYLGFVTLASSIIERADPDDTSSWLKEPTIAHELAHQWWGNLVGWWSYRDQWLSEGMANYSALLFGSHMEGGESNLLSVMSAGWRESLSQTTLNGRTIESLGPIVLGNRLNSSRGRNAFRVIVYRKGAAVLAMLARAVGEERFLGMLHSLVDAATNRVVTTESFLKSVERMSGLELEGFSRQFVYGTGIPDVYYRYSTSGDDDRGWILDGEARQLGTPDYRLEIARSTDGRWDVQRNVRPDLDSGPTTLMVPFQVKLEAAEQEQARPREQGRLFLQGEHDRFEIPTRGRPLELKLDPRGEILAHFYSSVLYPKRVLRYRAEDLMLEGDLDEAERQYLEALEVTGNVARPVDPLSWDKPAQGIGDAEEEDLRIWLSLARLYLDQDRERDAVAALERVESRLEGADEERFRVERETLQSRLEIRRGKYVRAHRRLKKTLRMASPRFGKRTWRNLIWRMRLNSERMAVNEAYALLAIASFETDHPDEFQWATEEARERGVDVSLLDLMVREEVRSR